VIFAKRPALDPARTSLAAAYLADEAAVAEARCVEARLPPDMQQRVAARARALVEAVRAGGRAGGLDAFLQEYSLGTAEGVVLMCLAEALLRIPDAETKDRLIRDRLSEAEWERHLGHSDSWLVNASTFGLMLTGRIMRLGEWPKGEEAWQALRRLVSRSGETVIREALVQALRIMGRQFVMGRTIGEALARAEADERRGYRHSFDMLGEAARTAEDAVRYFAAYRSAIEALGAWCRTPERSRLSLFERPSVSVKLSALHPRYELAKAVRVMAELSPRLLELAEAARVQGIGVTVDAEESERLDLSLDIIESVFRNPALEGWEGFGLAVQAYQKRARPLLDWLIALARSGRRRIPVRLVKGAYWDSEIKRGQEKGLPGYPVFTRKAATDASYIACAKAMLAAPGAIYPQLATHNAHTVAAVLELADTEFEFQRLHGMGESLYEPLLEKRPGVRCRIYAPVGSHEDLLPYLVRRLLENGANTSFVNRLSDLSAPIETIVADPVEALEKARFKPHAQIPLPEHLFGPGRRNSAGLELADRATLLPLADAMEAALRESWHAAPLVGGRELERPARTVCDPADRRRVVGRVCDADDAALEAAASNAAQAAPAWDAVPAEERARLLEQAADLLEARRAVFMALAVREAGKTIPDALAEVREATDFLRYYAHRARGEFGVDGEHLAGPTGEDNRLRLHGRGVFACISPWNFPLAIFLGQASAALAAGNAVIAKPAEQTPLIAAAALRVLHEAGVPPEVAQLLPGPGETVGARLIVDPRISGVVFTGSTEVARLIAQALAARPGPILPLIAETGGQNAMIVDSSALPEQVVQDVVASAFGSAGQRCSCLRVLFVQDDVAERILRMLAGAMAELKVGDPALLDTDIGPVIDGEAKAMLERHVARMATEGRTLAVAPLSGETQYGTFVAPRAVEIEGLARLEREVFGPILHIVRYSSDRLDKVIDDINATGYGLTLGIHSRIEGVVEHLAARARVGNIYVNRNMIGAVVGVQPFGGEGLSGTGPKAGGPHYLARFGIERVVSINTAATGGNTTLLTLAEPGD